MKCRFFLTNFVDSGDVALRPGDQTGRRAVGLKGGIT